MSFRMSLLNAMKPVAELAGKIHAPYSHREITGYHLYSATSHLIPGMPLVTRKNGELTNKLIGGEVTHLGTYCGSHEIKIDGHDFRVPFVVEAIGKGVVDTDLTTFMLSKDRVVACRPTFLTDAELRAIADWIISKIGSKYDYGFDPKNKAFYCSELWWAACKEVTGKGDIFTKRTTLGVETVAPQDYLNATAKFAQPWDSSKVPFHSAMRLLA